MGDGADDPPKIDSRMTTPRATLPLRIIPPLTFGSRRALRLIERNLYVYKHGWLVIVSGFFEPLFYLLSIGFGLGALVGTVPGPGGARIPYQLFVAPALLASSAMNGAITEATLNFFFKLKYEKTFDSILSTPLSTADIALGELGWANIRGALYTIGFLGVMVALGLATSPWVILTLPAALLISLAFGAVGMACTTFMRTWQDFDLIQLVILPLFLFSATFYPLETYPEPLRLIVQITPLYQGVDLLRQLAVGALQPSALFHVVYLAALGVAGLFVVSRRLDHLLLK
jgi:lipooligosaccharide transport system permease protein